MERRTLKSMNELLACLCDVILPCRSCHEGHPHDIDAIAHRIKIMAPGSI